MARPMQVPTRRFLFLAARRKVTLAPVYAALLVVLLLGLLGLLVAVWPPAATSERATKEPVDGNADGSRSFEGSYLPPRVAPKPRRAGTWM